MDKIKILKELINIAESDEGFRREMTRLISTELIPWDKIQEDIYDIIQNNITSAPYTIVINHVKSYLEGSV